MRLTELVIAAAGTIMLAMKPPVASPWVVWNTSPSVPLGLYVIDGSVPRRGDLALARLPAAIATMAHRRGYLPRTTYLLKPVVAITGDRVCRLGRRIVVRGAAIARAAARDTAGRPLPAWHGCRELAPGEVFVLARARQSFDSRYFGRRCSALMLVHDHARRNSRGDSCEGRGLPKVVG